MGSLKLPDSGLVYVDAQNIVYSVEKHPRYAPPLRSLWAALASRRIGVISSDLVLMETLIGPLKQGDAMLASTYEEILLHRDVRLLPITHSILREAARLRAGTRSLRTPDAIHAATGLISKCAMFLSNDVGFRRVPGLPLTILDEALAA